MTDNKQTEASDRHYEARVSTFRKEGTMCHLSMQTVEVWAKDEAELREIIAEEYEDGEATVDQIREVPEPPSAVINGPQVVCCVCGKPCSVFSPICADCAAASLATGATP